MIKLKKKDAINECTDGRTQTNEGMDGYNHPDRQTAPLPILVPAVIF